MATKDIGVDVVFGSRQKGVTAGLQKLQAQLRQASAKMRAAGIGLTAGITAPVVALGVASVSASIDFNKMLAQIGTLIPGQAKRLQEIKRIIMDMAAESGIAHGELASAMFNTISIYGDGVDTVDRFAQAVETAVAGQVDAAEAALLLGRVVAGFGDKSKETASLVSDLAFQTNTLGVTDLTQLAASVGIVSSKFAEAGGTLEEFFAVFATGTQVVSTNMVATQFKAIVDAFATLSPDLKALVEKLGFATGKAAIKALTFQGALEAVRDETRLTGLELSKFIASTDGQALALVLTGSQADHFTGSLKSMAVALGLTDLAYLEQTEGINRLGHQWNQLKRKLENIKLSIGSKLSPAVEKLNILVSRGIGFWERLHSETKTTLLIFAGLAATLGPLLILMSFAILLITPWSLLATAMLLVAAAVLVMWRNWATIGPALEKVIGTVFDVFIHIFSQFNNATRPILEAIKANFTAFIGAALFTFLAGAWLVGGKNLIGVLTTLRVGVAASVLLISNLFILGAIAGVVFWLAKKWDEDNNGVLSDAMSNMTAIIKKSLTESNAAWDMFALDIDHTVEKIKSTIQGLMDFFKAFDPSAAFGRTGLSFIAPERLGPPKPGDPHPSGAPQTQAVPMVPPAVSDAWKELRESILGTQQNIDALNQSMESSEFTDLFDEGMIARSEQVITILEDVNAAMARVQSLEPQEGVKERFRDAARNIHEQIFLLQESRTQLLQAQKIGEAGLLGGISDRFDDVQERYNKLFNDITTRKPLVPRTSSFFGEQLQEAKVELVGFGGVNTAVFAQMGQEVMSWGETVKTASGDSREQVAQELEATRAQMAKLSAQEIQLGTVITEPFDRALEALGFTATDTFDGITDASQRSAVGMETQFVGTAVPALDTFAGKINAVEEAVKDLGTAFLETAEGRALFDLIVGLNDKMKEFPTVAGQFETKVDELSKNTQNAFAEMTGSLQTNMGFWEVMFENFKFTQESVFQDIRDSFVQVWATLQSTFVSSLASMIQGVSTFSEFMTVFWNTLLQAGLNMILTVAAQWALSHLTMTEDALVRLAAEETVNAASLAGTAATEAARLIIMEANNKLMLGSAATTIAAMTAMGTTAVAIAAVVVEAIAAVFAAIAAGLEAGKLTAPFAAPFAEAAVIIGASGAVALGLAETAVVAAGATGLKAIGGLAATPFATGGIVTAPTLAMIGETGKKEAVIPLDRLDEFAGGGKQQTLVLEMDGRRLMQKLIPQVPKLVRMKMGVGL